MIVCNLLVKALDVSSQGVVVQAELLQIRRGPRYLHVSLVNRPFDLLGLIVDRDTLVLSVFDLLLCRFKVSLQDLHSFLLITDPVFVLSLLSADLVLKATSASLQVVEDLLKDLEVALPRLMILDLLSVGVDNAVAGVFSC